MVFTHDIELSLRCAAALINTMPGSVPGDSDPDRLTTLAELDAFAREWFWTGSRTHDQDELDAVRRLRPRLRRLWFLPEEEVVDEVNALLRDARALPQLTRHDDLGWHLHATRPDAPFAIRVAVEAAMSLSDVIRAGELERLKECEPADCDDVFVDLSKNRSRRFCDGTCGNRANVAAYRARRSVAR